MFGKLIGFRKKCPNLPGLWMFFTSRSKSEFSRNRILLRLHAKLPRCGLVKDAIAMRINTKVFPLDRFSFFRTKSPQKRRYIGLSLCQPRGKWQSRFSIKYSLFSSIFNPECRRISTYTLSHLEMKSIGVLQLYPCLSIRNHFPTV